MDTSELKGYILALEKGNNISDLQMDYLISNCESEANDDLFSIFLDKNHIVDEPLENLDSVHDAFEENEGCDMPNPNNFSILSWRCFLLSELKKINSPAIPSDFQKSISILEIIHSYYEKSIKEEKEKEEETIKKHIEKQTYEKMQMNLVLKGYIDSLREQKFIFEKQLESLLYRIKEIFYSCDYQSLDGMSTNEEIENKYNAEQEYVNELIHREHGGETIDYKKEIKDPTVELQFLIAKLEELKSKTEIPVEKLNFLFHIADTNKSLLKLVDYTEYSDDSESDQQDSYTSDSIDLTDHPYYNDDLDWDQQNPDIW